MNSPEIKQFIRENSSLFWYIPEKEKENISQELLVETILNYGDEKSMKKLFCFLGTEKVADVFYRQTHKNGIAAKRVNYFPRVIHFFNLYFKRHVPGYSF